MSGLCIKCEQNNCPRSFHEYCLSRYFLQNPQDPDYFCNIHQKSKLYSKAHSHLWQTRQLSNKIGLNPEAITKIKESQGDNKSYSICSGQVFWYVINSQYFPNFINMKKPEINVKTLIDNYENIGSDIQKYYSKLEKEYQNIKTANDLLIKQYEGPINTNNTLIKDYHEDEIILFETRNLKLCKGLEEYLKYYESKGRIDAESNINTEKRTSLLTESLKNEDDYICSICGDGDYDDDNLIVICSNCEIAAHVKCYGIPIIPDTDWICQACLIIKNQEARSNIRCALCPKKGGCIKQTIHTTTEDLSFPNYPEGKNEQVWCHIFCALKLDYNVFGDKEYLDNINLNIIDEKRFSLKCQVCQTKDGACLQCEHGRCQAAFHPECGRIFFTYTRNKTGYDEMGIYCASHRPLKLRSVIEGKDKRSVEDIISFCKAFEKYEKRMNNYDMETVVKRPFNDEKKFSCREKGKMIKLVENERKKIAEKIESGFGVIINFKAKNNGNRIKTIKPQRYNLLDPKVFLESKLTIKGRKYKECYKYYENLLYPLLKDELKIMGITEVQNTVKGKKKCQISSKKLKSKIKSEAKNEVKEATEIEDKSCKAKVLEKNIETVIEVPLLSDLVSKEVYCICRKPFIEKSFRRDWESEEDFQKRQTESQMIFCDDCREWYHYKCIGLKYDEKIPTKYTCVNCLTASYK
ncbi:hypothetical protein SteCoe_34289 [Stentor coeruleus]|uniref:PHD-type domain-containing protein n=1 Tax=Stentor coeruleus TaxID=5963 RepID=A0A1R2AUV0_9CILI|nr:hypothetical protein SteCoe_34289 [Stentor coeruleus]